MYLGIISLRNSESQILKFYDVMGRKKQTILFCPDANWIS